MSKDPRVIRALDNWSKSIQATGYNYLRDQDEEYEERLDALTERQDPRTLTGSRLIALRKLQAEEVAVSLVDLKCQVQYTDDGIRKVEVEVFGQLVSG